MKIILKNIEEALSGQNRSIEKQYVSSIFLFLKQCIEKREIEEILGKTLTKNLSFDEKTLDKINLSKKQRKIGASFSIKADVRFVPIYKSRKESMNFSVHGAFRGNSNENLEVVVNITAYISRNKEDNVQFFKRMYPNIFNNIQEVVHHELVHLYQFLDKDKDKRQEKTIASLDFNKSDIPDIEKEDYETGRHDFNRFTSPKEIEAYAKGLVYKYKKSQDKHTISFAEFVANSAYSKPEEIGGPYYIIDFYNKIIQYVSKFFPKIQIKDAERQMDRLKAALARNKDDKRKLSLIKTSKSS